MSVLWTVTVSCLAAAPWSAVEWPQFRGPQGDGITAARNLPLSWSETENVAWKTPIDGRGWSSPVVGDGVVWLTTAVEKTLSEAELEAKRKAAVAKNPQAATLTLVGGISLSAVAIDLDSGEVRHRIPLFEVADPDPIHSLNSYASPSPILIEDRLYCHFGTFGTACVETGTGRVVWKTRIPLDHAVGPGSSPVVYQDLMIIPCDGMQSQFVIALNTATGEVVWKRDRPPMEGTNGDLHKAFSTPLVVRHAGQDQVVAIGAQWVVAYNPLTGDEIWRVNHGAGFSNVPRPVAGEGVVYICTGFTKPEVWAIRLDGTGELTETHVLWKITRQAPAMPSPILVGEELYFLSDAGGVLTCVNAQSGEQVWQHRLGGNFSASPILADGKLYFASREGKVTVMKPGKQFEELASNELDGALMASPVALDGLLLLRTPTHLYRIGSGAGAAAAAVSE
jgi:outer membrane protein assembly factor BamB